ncbi:MAG TPA: HlyD family efflux transporter periplasmic adaptor subunit [Candidatus Paceibacterota bacterium]|nr:HlyD family efflux transporter periplasmic adaptor subunit [Candidatus Paceibacterota bacterium]
MTWLSRSWTWIKTRSRRTQIIGGVVLLLLIVALVHFLTRTAVIPPAPPVTPHVTLESASGLSSGAGPLSLTGKVSSLNQATILAETSGEVTSLPVKIGDQVYAGQQLGSFENSSQVAAVTQAQGAYDAAVAARNATSPTITDASARDAFASAYATAASTLNDDIDEFFGQYTPFGPQFLINDFNAPDFSRRRTAMTNLMNSWQADVANDASADPAQLLAEAYSNTQTLTTFANDIAASARKPGSNATDAQLTAITAAQGTYTGLLSTLSAAQAAYRSKDVSGNAGADATVMQALGALQGAKAALDKTIIRSPVAGTIVSLPITQGDFVAAFSTVAEVSNPHALEIDAQVTPSDAKTLAVGGKATVNGSVPGVIASIAPAVDPSTSKIPVKVDLSTSGDLVDGDTVTLSLTRTAAVRATAPTTASSTITIPIVATKITPQGPIVFTVASSTLVAHPITLGTLLGNQVTVLSGLTPDLMIVTDARGLSDGETVIVDTP